MRRTALSSAFAFALAVVATAGQVTFDVPRLRTVPCVDGVISRGEYAGAAMFGGAGDFRGAAIAGRTFAYDRRPTELAMVWDEHALRFAARSYVKGGKPVLADRLRPLVEGDSIELWISPPAEARKGEFARFGQFQLIVDSAGRTYARQHNPGYGLPTRNWKISDVRVANCVHGEWWDCEISIPASAFGADRIAPGEWRAVLGRNFRSEPGLQATYVPFSAIGGYSAEEDYPIFRLVADGAGSAFGEKTDLFSDGVRLSVPGNVTVTVRSPGDVPANKYRRAVSSQFDKRGYFGLQRTAAHDGRQNLGLFYHATERQVFRTFTSASVAPAGEDFTYSLNVHPERIEVYAGGVRLGEVVPDAPIRAEDLGQLVLGGGTGDAEIRSVRVSDRILGPDEIKLAAQGDRSLAGSLKWYPSKSSIACELSFPKPASKDALPVLTVFDSAGKRVLERRVPTRKESVAVTGGAHPMMVVHEVVPVKPDGKPLPDGEYRMVLRSGRDGKAEIEKSFRMRNYDWFNNQVGKRDAVLPGFTPVKADGRSVEVVLRKYVFGDDGLLQEVWADGRQILARPVSLRNGRGTVRGTVRALRITDEASTRVGYEGGLASGRVEQDGLIALDLDLPSTEGPVWLEIPVRAEYALLFHACGEGLRGNPAGFVPKGAGRLFGSRSISQTHVDNFIPYCWVGTDTRGICFAADSDRGWTHGTDRDAVELHREPDGTVTIRLNLIAGGGRHGARRIELALMASPVKPMPKGWRGWVDAYDVPAERNTLCNCSPPTWGSYTSNDSRYPTFMDWEYVRRMRIAAETGKVDGDYVDSWIARCWEARRKQPELVRWLARKTETEAKKTLRAHAYSGMNRPCFLKDKKNRVLYYYTCDADPCEGLYELDVMADEWGRFAAVFGSFQDYSVYYLKRMCEEGMSGVYNDNSYFRCNYDWVTGGAWIDEAGEVHPSFSLWSLREYARRQILAMQEAGVKDPWLTIHHTNCNALPTMAFATNTMGMEWKYGSSDYQDRYSPDYIRTVNQGLQCGCFPTSLEGIFGVTDPKERTRITRTMLAALLTHEVQPTLQACGDHALVVKVLKLKQEFGVGKDDCVYTAYWDPDNPVKSGRGDIMISTYRRGRRLLSVCGSYANEDVDLSLVTDGVVTRAIDAETGESVDLKTVRVPRRGFRMLELELVEKGRRASAEGGTR